MFFSGSHTFTQSGGIQPQQLSQAIQTLNTTTDVNERKKIEGFLLLFRRSPSALGNSLQLLSVTNDSSVQFFTATTIALKFEEDWTSVESQENWKTLATRIINTTIQLTLSETSDIVIRQLCRAGNQPGCFVSSMIEIH